MTMITNLLLNFTNFCIIIFSFFLTKLPTSGILFSTEVNAEDVPKPLILAILLSISLILALQSVFLTSSLVSGI